jgi:small-conductance mechanosensitive channel
VIVVPQEGKPFVYWGTPPLKATVEMSQWPQLYRERTEIQENSFKRLIDPGARETNYGRKKIVGPDRQQQRKREDLEASLETAQQRVANKVEALQEQQAKVAASKTKGHGTRLEQRQQALLRVAQELEEAQHQQGKWVAQVEALGAPTERADRDFRKQTIMTCRTLLLENALMAFMAALLGNLHSKVSLAGVLHLLLERSGASLETASAIVYWVNTTGLSLPYRRLLEEVVNGLSAMDLRAQGKPIRVDLKDMPP